MRIFIISLLFSLVFSVRLTIPSSSITIDNLLKEARCQSYCFTQCYKIHFDQLTTTFCESCKSTCESARQTASRKRIQAFLTPSLIVSDRKKGEIELDVTLSTACEQCLVVLEYRFIHGSAENTVSKWIPYQIVTPGVYSFGGLSLDSAYQFRIHLVYLWQSKKIFLTQWADLTDEP